MIIKDESILRLPCEDVKSIEEAEEIIKQLELELKKSNDMGVPGIGLAAPQINIHKKVAIIRLEKYSVNLVNAQISKKYDQIIFNQEGCLSFPGKNINTKRFNEIFIENNFVEPQSFTATGLLAVAIQHEIDHYNSILFQDNEVINKPITNVKIGLNDKCTCGSGLKYKKCCRK